MLARFRSVRILVASLAAAMVASPAFAATASHPSPHQPIATETAAVAASPATEMPYTCAKSELNTRLERKACF